MRDIPAHLRQERVLAVNQLYVTLQGQRVNDNGVPVAGFVAALQGVQDAMRLMIEHLSGRSQRSGRRPKWITKQSALRVVGTRRGSLVAELALDSPPSDKNTMTAYGERAFESLQNWDGSENSTLPRAVADRLFAIPQKLPENVHLWLGNEEHPCRVQIRRTVRVIKRMARLEEAQLYGWLKAVNWNRRIAQLHRYGESRVQLRFRSTLDQVMRSLAMQYVEVKGKGTLNEKERWRSIQVEQVRSADIRRKPFDIEAFQGESSPKVFRRDRILRASEPFDVEDFNRIIREGRDV